jgi:REP element-mobilizing transposase RayT
VQAAWDDLSNHFAGVSLDAFIVMPNHVHGIVGLQVLVGAGLKPGPTQITAGLFEVVRAFKTFSARSVNKLRGTQGVPAWQRNYYEHIVRSKRNWTASAIISSITQHSGNKIEKIPNEQQIRLRNIRNHGKYRGGFNPSFDVNNPPYQGSTTVLSVTSVLLKAAVISIDSRC